MLISVEKTAITNGVAKSVFQHYNYFPVKGHILDYGAGKLRNAWFLKEKGFNVSILDTPLQISKIKSEDWDGVYSSDLLPNHKFDGVICTFVLNVIPSIEERTKVMLNIHFLLKEEGIAVIEVRAEKGILSTKYREPYLDGYIIGKGNIRTFQKPYTIDELISFIHSFSFECIKECKYSDSVALILRRK